MEGAGGGELGGAAPHDAMPQQPLGRASLHVTLVPTALHVILQSDGGIAPSMPLMAEACKKVRCGSSPNALRVPVRPSFVSNQTLRRLVSGVKSMSGPLSWLWRIRKTWRFVRFCSSVGMCPLSLLCEKYMHFR